MGRAKKDKSSKVQERLVALEERRKGAMRLLSEGLSQAEVAQNLGVSGASVSRWSVAYRDGGEAALSSPGRAGRKPRLAKSHWEQVEAKLLAGPVANGYQTELWTLDRIADVVEKVTGVRYHIGHLSRLLKAMGWSCQKPKRKAKERDEAAIQQWVKQEWPAIQRGHKNKTPS